MNKLKLITVLVISSILFAACGSKSNSEETLDKTVTKAAEDLGDLKRLTNNYSLEQAKADGCLVMEDCEVTSGKEVFEEFLNQTSKKISAKIRVVNYYTLDKSSVSEEYYEQEKDNYPLLFITDVVYENDEYKTYSYANNDDELIEHTYKYLIKDEFEANREATFTNATYYMLVNDKSLTFNEIMFEMAKSNLSEKGKDISNFIIYQTHIYK